MNVDSQHLALTVSDPYTIVLTVYESIPNINERGLESTAMYKMAVSS